jgi:excisionase family DNA binding protein
MKMGSIKQAADLLLVHPRTITRRINDGTIHAYQIGGTTRIDLDELLTETRKPAPVDTGELRPPSWYHRDPPQR